MIARRIPAVDKVLSIHLPGGMNTKIDKALSADRMAVRDCAYDRLGDLANDHVIACLICAAERFIPDYPRGSIPSPKMLLRWRDFIQNMEIADKAMSPADRLLRYGNGGFGTMDINRVAAHAIEFVTLYRDQLRKGM